MFAPLLNGIRADIHQQIGWAKVEVRRQTRYTVVIGVLAVMATLAALGSIIVGLIAIYLWMAPQIGPFAALGGIGSGLLLLAPDAIRFGPRLAATPVRFAAAATNHAPCSSAWNAQAR